mmetsp:Transcript_39299/g.78742  ORF Transcript_39299/g.78742 Transcript_39299/m.78742 type:complete len:223 (+) Transcript_39299:135-803(+)
MAPPPVHRRQRRGFEFDRDRVPPPQNPALQPQRGGGRADPQARESAAAAAEPCTSRDQQDQDHGSARLRPRLWRASGHRRRHGRRQSGSDQNGEGRGRGGAVGPEDGVPDVQHLVVHRPQGLLPPQHQPGAGRRGVERAHLGGRDGNGSRGQRKGVQGAGLHKRRDRGLRNRGAGPGLGHLQPGPASRQTARAARHCVMLAIHFDFKFVRPDCVVGCRGPAC